MFFLSYRDEQLKKPPPRRACFAPRRTRSYFLTGSYQVPGTGMCFCLVNNTRTSPYSACMVFPLLILLMKKNGHHLDYHIPGISDSEIKLLPGMRFYLVPVYLRVPGIRTTNTRWRCRRINTSWYVALHGTAVPGTLFLLEPPTRTASVLLVYCSYRALNKTTTVVTIVLSWLAGSV